MKERERESIFQIQFLKNVYLLLNQRYHDFVIISGEKNSTVQTDIIYLQLRKVYRKLRICCSPKIGTFSYIYIYIYIYIYSCNFIWGFRVVITKINLYIYIYIYIYMYAHVCVCVQYSLYFNKSKVFMYAHT